MEPITERPAEPGERCTCGGQPSSSTSVARSAPPATAASAMAATALIRAHSAAGHGTPRVAARGTAAPQGHTRPPRRADPPFKQCIPTLFPRSEAGKLHLRACAACGRPWQRSTEGACPKCPRITFGPSPSTVAQARRFPQPKLLDIWPDLADG
jgi:hypothetical protein